MGYMISLRARDVIIVLLFMQSKQRWTTLKGPFFAALDKLDKNDLRVSEIFAFLTIALSLLTCSSAREETSSFSWILFSLLQFPLNLSWLGVYAFGWSFGVAGGLFAFIPFYILSFVFKVAIFYSLARLTRKVLGQQDTVLLRHLPSLLICIIFYIVFGFSILQCRFA